MGKGGEIVSKLVGLTQRSALGAVGDMAGKTSLSLFTEAVNARCGSVAPVDSGIH